VPFVYYSSRIGRWRGWSGDERLPNAPVQAELGGMTVSQAQDWRSLQKRPSRSGRGQRVPRNMIVSIFAIHADGSVRR
jgi:hypothetical protein